MHKSRGLQSFIDITARCSRLVMQTEVVTIASMMFSPFLSIVFIPRREVAVGIETQVIAHMTLVVVCVDVHLDIAAVVFHHAVIVCENLPAVTGRIAQRILNRIILDTPETQNNSPLHFLL